MVYLSIPIDLNRNMLLVFVVKCTNNLSKTALTKNRFYLEPVHNMVTLVNNQVAFLIIKILPRLWLMRCVVNRTGKCFQF